MPRIYPVQKDSAEATTKGILEAVEQKMGMVPNLVSTMAQSPAVANAYLGFSQALGEGALSPRLREQLSLVVGETNSCGYCVSAHTLLGKGVGLDDSSVIAARHGKSEDAKENAALQFAQKVVQQRADVSDADVASLREVGFGEGEISEIVANISLNLFTNYFNHVAGTEIDFPVAPEL